MHFVNFVELFCDTIENEFTPELLHLLKDTYTDKSINMPATLAAIRLHYYINNKHFKRNQDRSTEAYVVSQSNYRYKQLAFLLLNKQSTWYSLSTQDKAQLISFTGMRSTIFVY